MAADEEINVEVNSNIGEVAKDTKKATGELTLFQKGIKGIGTAIKAAGIGLLIGMVAKLLETFSKNQYVVDAFSTAMNFLSVAFSDFVNFIGSSLGPVTDYFKALFDNPVQSIKDFGTAIKDNLIERFNSFLDTLGYIASAIKNVFSGNFGAAMDDVKSAGKEMVDVYTGVNNSVDKLVDGVTKGAKAITKYTKATWKKAEAITAADKAANLAATNFATLNAELTAQAAEQQRILDDELAGIDAKLEAYGKLEEIQKKQHELAKENIETMIKQAQHQYNLNKSDENFIALQDQKNALTELEIAQMAEQDALFDKKIAINDAWNTKQQEEFDKEVERQKLLKELEAQKVQAAKSTFQNLAQIAGEETEAGKALAITAATIDTFQAAQAAYKSMVGIPVVGPALGGIAAAAAVAAGMKNIQAIKSASSAGVSGGGGVSAPVSGTPAPQMMSGAFDISGGIPPEATRAYVVTDEMTNSQNQLANIRRRATI
jgi:hypothetical protein